MTKKKIEQQKPTLKEEMRPLRKMMPWLTIEVSEDEDEQKNRKHYVMTEKVNNKQESQEQEDRRLLRKTLHWLTIDYFDDEDEQKTENITL